MTRNVILNQDCIVGMQQLPNKSIDLILCDLPYGTTNCKWDSIISFEQLWQEHNRIIKDKGVIVLTSVQPFTTRLIQSNIKQFKYCWYWLKNQVTGYPFAKYQPMRCIEDVCVFYKSQPTYNPQGLIKRDKPLICKRKGNGKDCIYKESSLVGEYISEYTGYPKNLLEFKCERGLHPTQKPVTLFEYIIKTYTNKGDLVLDCTAGSCTTAIACINTNRDYICIELDTAIYNTAVQRVHSHQRSEVSMT